MKEFGKNFFIIDSNFLFALKNKHDKYHEKAINILNDIFDPKNVFFTNYLVINEIINLTIARTRGNQESLKVLQECIWGDENFFHIIQLEPLEYNHIYEILLKYCNSKILLSFVDASLIYLFKKYKMDFLLSFDSHFDNIVKRIY